VSFIPFTLCKERVKQDNGGEGEKGPSVMESLKSLIKNKYWVLEVIFLFVLYFMMSTMFGSQFYYMQYVVGNVGAFGTVSSIVQIFQIALMLLAAPFLMKKFGKRVTALAGMGASLLGYVLTALAGTNIPFLIVANAIKGAMESLKSLIKNKYWVLEVIFLFVLYFMMSYLRGLLFSQGFVPWEMKIGSGIGTAALGWILAAGNFDAAPESASSIAALGWAYIWVPIIACAIGVVCLIFFDLDKKYDTIVKDLEEGKWKGTSEHKDL